MNLLNQFGRDSAWNQKETFSKSVLNKMGGMKQGFQKPAGKKRKAEGEGHA